MRSYWVVRTSWGTSFGAGGWLKLRMGQGRDLGIERECAWGVPSEVSSGEAL